MAMTFTAGRGWCTRCGRAYETPTRPTCECAGEPPVTLAGKVNNLDPERAAYNRRVRELRHVDRGLDDPDARDEPRIDFTY